MQTDNWGAYIGYAIPSIIGFGARYFQERNKKPKPDIGKQIAASVFISYIAFFLYKDLNEFSFFGGKPFKDIHVWIALNSYFGSYIVTQVDRIMRTGWREWLKNRINEILATPDKEKKK